MHRKVVGLIPCQGSYGKQQINVSLLQPPSLSLSLKSINISTGEDSEKKKKPHLIILASGPYNLDLPWAWSSRPFGPLPPSLQSLKCWVRLGEKLLPPFSSPAPPPVTSSHGSHCKAPASSTALPLGVFLDFFPLWYAHSSPVLLDVQPQTLQPSPVSTETRKPVSIHLSLCDLPSYPAWLPQPHPQGAVESFPLLLSILSAEGLEISSVQMSIHDWTNIWFNILI